MLVKASLNSQLQVLLLKGKRLSKLIWGPFAIPNPLATFVPPPPKVTLGTMLSGLAVGLNCPRLMPVVFLCSLSRSDELTTHACSLQAAYPMVTSFTHARLTAQ